MTAGRQLLIRQWRTHTQVCLVGPDVDFELRTFRHRNQAIHALSYASRVGDLFGIDTVRVLSRAETIEEVVQ